MKQSRPSSLAIALNEQESLIMCSIEVLSLRLRCLDLGIKNTPYDQRRITVLVYLILVYKFAKVKSTLQFARLTSTVEPAGGGSYFCNSIKQYI